MQTYHIGGMRVSVLEKAEHKLKQLNEASKLLEEFSDRCAWAHDFSEYESICDSLYQVESAIDLSKEEIDEMIEAIEDEIEKHKQRIELSEEENERELYENIQELLE